MIKNNYPLPMLGTLAASIILLCAACKKTSTNPQNNISNGGDVLTELENYCHVADIKADGTFIFESNVTNNDSALVNTVIAGGAFYSKAGGDAKGGGPLTIGTHQFLPDTAGSYGFIAALSQKGLYGVNVSFSLTPPPSQIVAGASSTVAASIYSPAAIYIRNIAPMVAVTAVKNTPLPLTWNADPANPNGVFIVGEYSPISQENRAALNAGYSEEIDK